MLSPIAIGLLVAALVLAAIDFARNRSLTGVAIMLTDLALLLKVLA